MSNQTESLLREIRDRYTYASAAWEEIRKERQKDMRYICGKLRRQPLAGIHHQARAVRALLCGTARFTGIVVLLASLSWPLWHLHNVGLPADLRLVYTIFRRNF